MRDRTARSRRARWLGLALIVTSGAVGAEPSAPTFNLMPTRLVIKPRETTASLLLRNESPQLVRFQVSAFGWSNDTNGQIVLEPTTELVFFPTVFSVEPGASRRVRVATSQKAIERELSYRLVIEQLPTRTEAQPTGVQMLMRASVPVFVQPANLVARAAIEHAAIADGQVSFDVRNVGTTFVMITQAEVRGTSGGTSNDTRNGTSGQIPFLQRMPGWYLLSGETRTYRVALPAEVCRAQERLTIAVTFDGKPPQTLTADQPVSTEACGR
jgi:fimbrial chaperone protein